MRRAVPAVRNGNIRKGPTKNSTTRGAPKVGRLQKTQRIGQECKTGIWGCNLKKQLSLQMKRTSRRNFRKTTRLELNNLLVCSTTGDRKQWSIGPSTITKKTKTNKMDWYTETDCTSSRNSSRWSVLKREQREQLDNNHYQDWTTEKQRDQLENNHHEDWTRDTSRRNGLLYCVRPFGRNGLKEGAMLRVWPKAVVTRQP
jgi:hypothetical protein